MEEQLKLTINIKIYIKKIIFFEKNATLSTEFYKRKNRIKSVNKTCKSQTCWRLDVLIYCFIIVTTSLTAKISTEFKLKQVGIK